MDPDTSAFQALDWLANDDPLQLKPTNNNTQLLMQRWTLATLYFATSSSSWNQRTNWLSSHSVCDWQGVDCEILSQSDWFDVTLGSRSSASDAAHALGGTPEEPPTPTKDIVRLNLSHNGLAGTIPPEIRHLSQLMGLDLSHNQLTGSLPQGEILGHYLRLTDLRLSYNRLTGELPDSIGFNMILKNLELDHNHFRGTIPDVWGQNLRNLRNWTLQQNFLTGSIPMAIEGMKHIERLDWSENQLTGFLPFGLCKLSTLKSVQLQFNSLEGPVPPEFMMSAKVLEVLDLGHNHLTGKVPDVMETSFAAPNLRVFHLSSNDFSGPLPRTLGHTTLLTSLELDHNHFTGWIPGNWQTLTNLEVLRLQDNKLGGNVPLQLSRLKSLQELQFQNNLLQPQLPNEILEKLPNLHYHSVGFYTSNARDMTLDTILASEQTRMRRQREMMKDEKPSAPKYDDEEM